MRPIEEQESIALDQILSPNEARLLAEDEVSLSAVFHVIAENKRKISAVIVGAALVAIPVVFLIPVKYRAEAVILTPQQSQPSLSALAQASGVGASAIPGLSLLAGLGIRNPADLQVGILKSRTIADDLVRQYDLKRVYGYDLLTNARKRLAKNTNIQATKDSLIHIEVEDRDPHRAAALANSYLDELIAQGSRLALTEASQRRAFFERELAKEKNLLADAEISMRDTEQATGLVVPAGQTEALIRAGVQLRAQIMSREAELEVMKTYAAEENPRLQAIRSEISALQEQLGKIERGSGKTGVLDLPTGHLPEASLKYLRSLRDVKYHEALFEILAKQYEAARLDEAKSSPTVQVLDRATVPEKKSWPPRTLLVVSAALLAAIVSTAWVLRSAVLR